MAMDVPQVILVAAHTYPIIRPSLTRHCQATLFVTSVEIRVDYEMFFLMLVKISTTLSVSVSEP